MLRVLHGPFSALSAISGFFTARDDLIAGFTDDFSVQNFLTHL